MIKQTPPLQSAQDIAAQVTAYLGLHPNAAAMQKGITLFTMEVVECDVDASHERCSLYFWAENLNMRRRVVEAEEVKGCLRLTFARLGSKRKEVMWLTPNEKIHHLTPKQNTRLSYADLMRTAVELKIMHDHCASPSRRHVRLVEVRCEGPCVVGMAKWGTQKWALIGVGSHESYDAVNGLLRSGLVWLSKCRTNATRGFISGLKVVCPTGSGCMMRSRIEWLASGIMVELYEFDEDEKQILRFPCDRGASCLPTISKTFNQEALYKRSVPCIAKLLVLLPAKAAYRIDLQAISPSLLSVRLDGLEFASVRIGPAADSPKLEARLFYNLARRRAPLEGHEVELHFSRKMIALFTDRGAEGARTSSYYRSGADAWLTKIVRKALPDIEPGIPTKGIYQATNCSSHGIDDSIDLLTVSKDGTLLIVSVRADATRALPIHGLDQWIRIRELNQTGELKRAGYFPGIAINDRDPHLIFVAPALRMQEESELILGFFCKAVTWQFVAISEDWRNTPQVVYRKSGFGSHL